jgi:hypothetical protein
MRLKGNRVRYVPTQTYFKTLFFKTPPVFILDIIGGPNSVFVPLIQIQVESPPHPPFFFVLVAFAIRASAITFQF